MNDLSNFLVESILLEADSVDNKVVVYAGRFQPFHKGHYATYSHLVKKFGKDNVYIGTSNKTDNQKSPFNFKEKVMIMNTMFGIPKNRIVQVKNPYVPTEVLKKFDKDTTAFITVVGKKDASRLGGKFFTPYKDNLDFEGYEDKGYVYIAPQQSNPISGTDVRKGLGNGTDEEKKKFFTKRAYPKFNDRIFNLITDKLSKMNEERIFITKEQLEEWLVNNVDLIKEASKVGGAEQADDGPNFLFPTYASFDRVSKKRAEKIGYEVLAQIMSDELTDIDSHPIYPNGPVKAATPFPAGVIGKTTATNQKDFYGSEAYRLWHKHATRLATLVGYSVLDSLESKSDEKETKKTKRVKDPNTNIVSEDINIPINVGDTVLGGKFKNKRIVVKTIGKNEKGDITINGKPLLKVRIIEESVIVEFSGEEVNCNKCNHQWEITSTDDRKYLCHNCGWDSQMSEFDFDALADWKAKYQSMSENTIDNHNDSSVPYGSGYEKINESSLTISIKNIVDGLFPKEFFWVNDGKDKERVKSVISDLVRTLNTFYKKQGIKVRFTDTNFKMKMYSKEIKEGLSSSESLEHMKLLNKAMKVMPGSKKQKEIIKQLNVLRIKGGMKPLREDLTQWVTESTLNEFGGVRFDLVGYDSNNKPVLKTIKRASDSFMKDVVKGGSEKHFKSGKGVEYIKVYYDKHHLVTVKDGGRDVEKEKSWGKLPINEIPMADLVKIDTFADKQLKPVDVVLTDKHFFDRLNDPRNGKEVSNAELIGFFKRLGKKKKEFMNFLNQYNQIVAKDNRTNLNIPFMKQANKIIAKTIMRKDDFKTSSPEYKFEVAPHGYPDQKWIDDHNKELKKLRKKFDKEELQYNEPYALSGGIAERIDGDSIVCDNCGWNWKIKDGGLDMFICHKCGHDNEPNYTTKEINEMIRLKELLNEVLLTEGGAYGHMNHPFDTEINLTFGQLKDIVNKALEGNLELAREKTDGQALAVSWRDGRLVAARNKGHLKNKGENALDINGVATKFAGRGELEKAYNFAMNDLSKAIKSLSEKQREKIFKGGACFMNLEVIYPTSVNVIPYGQALLVFHGTMEYNEEGIAIGENQAAARILAGMIKQVNQDVQSAYTIQGPPINELPKSKNLSSLKGKYNSQISKLQSKFKLKDTDGIADYHQAFWMDFVTKKSPTKLDNRTLMGLVKRWAFYDKSFRLDKKNFSDEKTLEWVKGIDKNDHAKIAKDNIRPFEDIFLGVGADILSFMGSVLAANPDKAVRDMKKRLDNTIKDVRKSGDVKKIQKLKLELQRLNAIGGKDKIVPNEGIVFVYNGKTFKLTGTFAPLNQILGLFYE